MRTLSGRMEWWPPGPQKHLRHSGDRKACHPHLVCYDRCPKLSRSPGGNGELCAGLGSTQEMCPARRGEHQRSMSINGKRLCIGWMYIAWMTVRGGMLSHRQAEEPTAWTAVMLDHMWPMDFAEHHERHPAGWPHGLSFYRSIGTSPQLTKKVAW